MGLYRGYFVLRAITESGETLTLTLTATAT